MTYNDRIKCIKDMYREDSIELLVEPDKDILPVSLSLTIKDINTIHNDNLLNVYKD
jgi:hypothetical protein